MFEAGGIFHILKMFMKPTQFSETLAKRGILQLQPLLQIVKGFATFCHILYLPTQGGRQAWQKWTAGTKWYADGCGQDSRGETAAGVRLKSH